MLPAGTSEMLGEILNVQGDVSVQRIRSKCQGDVTLSETLTNCTMNQALNLDLKRNAYFLLNIKTVIVWKKNQPVAASTLF